MVVRKDIKDFIKTIPDNINIVAASKYVDADQIKILFDNGITTFGENRVDDFLAKYEQLSDINNIKWHFIGHLQKNKANKIINKIDCLHSLDSLELAKIIDRKREIPLDTFIEVSINLEENKNGVPYYQIKEFVEEILKYKNIHLVGLMMMAIKHDDNEALYKQFNKLKEIKNDLEKSFNIKLDYLSMGMSDDYKIAIEAGSTHIRLGRILFE